MHGQHVHCSVWHSLSAFPFADACANKGVCTCMHVAISRKAYVISGNFLNFRLSFVIFVSS